MSAQTQTNTPAKQAARNALFAAGLRPPQAFEYAAHYQTQTHWYQTQTHTIQTGDKR